MATITSDKSNGYSISLTLTQKSQSVYDNTTVIEWVYKISCGSAYYQNSSTKDSFKAVINGTTVLNTSKAISFSGANTSITIASGTLKVTHNSDGTKSISASCSYTPGKTASYYPGSMSKNGTMTLTTIPRASTPSLVTYPDTTERVEIGSTILVHMNRKSDSFTHTVKYSWYGKKETIAEGVESNVSWLIPMKFCDDIPDSTTGSGTVTVETYNGTTLIGTKSIAFKGTVPPSAIPIAGSLSVLEAVSSVKELTGMFIQNKSKLNVSIVNSVPVYSSPIVSYHINVAGQHIYSQQGVSDIIKKSGTITITAVVVDARGRMSDIISTDVYICPYTFPVLKNIANNRGDTTCVITANGSCCSLLNGTKEKNKFKYKILYRERGTSTWNTLENTNITTLVFDLSVTIKSLNSAKSYEFQLYAGDIFGYTYPYAFSISTAKVYRDHDVKNGRTGINKKLEYDDSTLEFNEDASIYVGANKMLLKNLLDSGWINCTINSNFESYAGIDVQVRKVGKVVHLRGMLNVKTTFTPTSDSSHSMFTIPSGYRPSKIEACLCGASGGGYRYRMTVRPTGVVNISRFTNSTTINMPVPVDTVVECYATWFID